MEMLGIKSNLEILVTSHSQLFVRYRAINTWNGISGDLRSSLSLCTFKTIKLRQLYLSLLHSFQIYVVGMIIKLLSYSSTEVTMQYS